MSDADPFAGSVGLPSISFATKDEFGNMTSKPVGTRIGGKVLKAPSLVQRRNFQTKLPEAWPDGNPKMSVVVDICVDGEDMSLWVKKPSQLFKAFGEAIEAAGNVPVAPGADIYVTLIGFEKSEGDNAPAKVYRVDYAPANSFASPPASNGSAPKPTTPEGYTLDSLLAAGWGVAQIAAQYPQLVPAPPVAAPPPPPPAPPVAAAPPPPPPAPPAPPAPAVNGQAERDAKIAAMSPEDRQLLGL